MGQFIARLIPFVMAGVAIVALAFGLFILAYLFIFGALVGLTLFLASWIRQKFFPTQQLNKTEKKKAGHTIEHDDIS